MGAAVRVGVGEGGIVVCSRKVCAAKGVEIYLL